MTVLHIDFETRSELDLREVGLHNYARHPSTDVWCAAWSINDNDLVPVWTPGGEVQWPKHADISQCQVYAHNAPFELEIWNNIMVPRYGWPELKPEQTFCTMAMAYAMGLPGALEDAALALGLQILKDTEGRSLMLRLARPRSTNPTVWWDEPEKLARLYAYCQQDVRVERELHKRLMPLSAHERKVWLLDYSINQRGAQIDVPSAKAAVDLALKMKVSYDDQMAQATKGEATTCTALGPIKAWLAARGLPEALDGLDKAAVAAALDRPDLSPEVKNVLTLRQEAGRSSTAKFAAMVARAGSDGRLRQTKQYHGAATGRWAGRGVQTDNLNRDTPPANTVERVLALVRDGRADVIDAIYGPPMSMLSQCLRSFFIAKPGHVLIAGDFANVEGRGVAWLSGENWKLQAFRAADAGTGPGLYELAYAKSFGVDAATVKNPSVERQIGKVQELLLGFGGSVGAIRRGGGRLVADKSDDELASWVEGWRNAHPAVAGVRTYNSRTGRWFRRGGAWNQLEDAAIAAVDNPGQVYEAGYPGRQVKYKVAGSFLWCLLPSGRALCYPYPKILEGDYGPQLTYMKVPSATGTEKIVHDSKNSSNWARVKTYGGSLMENCIQALCRDLLVDRMLTLDAMGAQIVLHVHDEIVVEVAKEKSAVAVGQATRLMREVPAWAEGFPLFAKCDVMERYGQ